MTDNLTKTAPEKIYLWSIYTEGRDVDFEEANWSTEQRGECHIEYVRADLVPTWKDAPDTHGLWLRRRFSFGRLGTEFIEVNAEMEARRFNETFGKLDRFGRGGWYGPIPEGK